ncbi:hypothetical protein IE4771_PE00081 (plasmid) [Rhizobium etli bv. mimosae str. IE4771]|uniref:Uncharacterized protein n=1 Tax=Rhizobium etli bv. mimosae str. IE4771 TaxID=1432050 RepID=A0A060IC28_RHIET|nr:hypothetical protein IE4771_PE00081 [Rhizobium sp. IE4771]
MCKIFASGLVSKKEYFFAGRNDLTAKLSDVTGYGRSNDPYRQTDQFRLKTEEPRLRPHPPSWSS